MTLSHGFAGWKNVAGMPLRPFTCTERRGEGLCVSCRRGAPPSKKSVNTRDLGPKSGQSHKSLISKLDRLQLYMGKVELE